MKYAIVYSSKTGNTQSLAEEIHNVLPSDNCIYYGELNEQALDAELIFVGFWTRMGRCNKEVKQFLKKLTSQKLFLFGTAGYGRDEEYTSQIIERSLKFVPKHVETIGTFMCPGRMELNVRHKYEKRLKNPIFKKKANQKIRNFDLTYTHPDDDDFAALKRKVEKLYSLKCLTAIKY